MNVVNILNLKTLVRMLFEKKYTFFRPQSLNQTSLLFLEIHTSRSY